MDFGRCWPMSMLQKLIHVLYQGSGLMSLFGGLFHITKPAISVGNDIPPKKSWVMWNRPGHQSQPLYMRVSWVIGVPQAVIIHFFRWERFSRSTSNHPAIKGYPDGLETPWSLVVTQGHKPSRHSPKIGPKNKFLRSWTSSPTWKKYEPHVLFLSSIHHYKNHPEPSWKSWWTI